MYYYMNNIRICPEGKELNPITGRCIKKCPVEKIRNPRTGRCTLKRECPPGYVRDPKTRRCIKFQQESKNYGGKKVKECPKGKEPNPKTGRCIKKCPPGKKRNPTTGRCNKIQKNNSKPNINENKKRNQNLPKTSINNLPQEVLLEMYKELNNTTIARLQGASKKYQQNNNLKRGFKGREKLLKQNLILQDNELKPSIFTPGKYIVYKKLGLVVKPNITWAIDQHYMVEKDPSFRSIVDMKFSSEVHNKFNEVAVDIYSRLIDNAIRPYLYNKYMGDMQFKVDDVWEAIDAYTEETGLDPEIMEMPASRELHYKVIHPARYPNGGLLPPPRGRQWEQRKIGNKIYDIWETIPQVFEWRTSLNAFEYRIYNQLIRDIPELATVDDWEKFHWKSIKEIAKIIQRYLLFLSVQSIRNTIDSGKQLVKQVHTKNIDIHNPFTIQNYKSFRGRIHSKRRGRNRKFVDMY